MLGAAAGDGGRGGDRDGSLRPSDHQRSGLAAADRLTMTAMKKRTMMSTMTICRWLAARQARAVAAVTRQTRSMTTTAMTMDPRMTTPATAKTARIAATTVGAASAIRVGAGVAAAACRRTRHARQPPEVHPASQSAAAVQASATAMVLGDHAHERCRLLHSACKVPATACSTTTATAEAARRAWMTTR